MILRKRLALAVISLAFSVPCFSQGSTLKERAEFGAAGFGGMQTAADHMAVLLSQAELCEQRIPEFSSDAASSLARVRVMPTTQEVVSSAEYTEVLPQARAFVEEYYQSGSITDLCRNALKILQSLRP